MIKTLEELNAVLAAGVVFDWHLAADLLRAYRPNIAHVSNYETTVVIWQDGCPVIPKEFPFANKRGFELQIGEEDSHGMGVDFYNCECAQSEHPEWNEKTCWPTSAVQLLEKKR